MAQMAQCGTSTLGNTKPKRERSRAYAITLNNYSEQEYENLRHKAQEVCSEWGLGKEIGTNGTPHIQGFLRFKNPTEFSVVKSWNERMHIEKCRGNLKQNIAYCSKDGNYEGTHDKKTEQEKIKEKILKQYENVIWKEWQQKIINIICEKANNRTINWVFDPIGNQGKTFLRKFLALKYQCLICDGKKDNILNQLKVKCIDNNENIEIVICDIPRHNQDFINYGILEQLKDGHVYSGKYEGAEIWLEDVHVIVFSNQMPDLSKFSEDRWNIIELSNVGNHANCHDIQSYNYK